MKSLLALLVLLTAWPCEAQVRRRAFGPRKTSSGGITNINGLVIWLQGNLITNANNGDAVTKWWDVSPAGTNHFSMDNASRQPMYTNSIGPNKLGSVNFNPVANNGGLTNRINNTLLISSTCMVFCVVNTWGTGNFTWVAYGNTDDYWGMYSLQYGGTNVWSPYNYHGTTYTSTSVIPVANTNHVILMMQQDGQANGCKFWINNTNVATTSQYDNTGSYLSLGGYYAAATYPFPGEMGEFMWFNRTLSSGEQSYVWTYLSTKYGIGIAP